MTCRSCGGETPYPAAVCLHCGHSLAPRRPTRLAELVGEYGCFCALGGWIAGIALVFAVFGLMALHRARAITVRTANARAVSLALRAYAAEWDATLPPADTWCDAIRPYLPEPSPLCLSRGTPGKSDLWINRAIAGRRLSALSPSRDVVAVFEGARGWNRSGGREDLRFAAHGGGAIGFLSGQGRVSSRQSASAAPWDP